MTETRSQPVDMRVDDVVVDESGEEPRQIILLQEVGGDRGFPIWIGRPEATAIVAQLQNIQLPRPLTASFAASLLEAAGARLQEVRITRITNEVIYAVVALDTPQGEREIDARPSDAIALALILGAPIRAETEVLDQAAISGPRAGTATRFRIDPAMFAPHARAEER